MRNDATRTQILESGLVDSLATLEAERVALEQRVAALLADIETLEAACEALRRAQAQYQKKSYVVR